MQLHLFTAQARGQQLQGLLQHITQTQPLAQPRRAFTGKGFQVPSEPGDALQQRVDTLQPFAHIVLPTTVEQQTQAAQLHLHGGQRLIDFMGHGRRHLPQRRHLRRMHQAFLRFAQFGGTLRHLKLQAFTNARLQALGLAPLGQVEQQEGQGHPHSGGGQAVAAHAVEQVLGLMQQVQGPVFILQTLSLPKVIARAIRALHPAPLAIAVDLPA